jgi:DNA (cytosine-5)-methyltransferase 1
MGPRYVVVENVAALLTRGLGDVLGTLADCGYDAEWSCVQACDVGAPHRRDRVFILAYAHGQPLQSVLSRRCAERGAAPTSSRTVDADEPGGGGARSRASTVADAERIQGRERHFFDVLRRRTSEAEQAGVGRGGGTPNQPPDVADPERRGLQGGVLGCTESAAVVASAVCRESRGADERGPWHAEPDVGRLAHGLPRRLVERSLSALGNAVVPQVAEVVGRLIASYEAARSLAPTQGVA